MADLGIRQDFIDGVQEIFTTLFNEGISDGINFYGISSQTQTNVYGEAKNKIYKQPVCLVAQARINPTQGEEDVKTIKNISEFVVPIKSLQERGFDISDAGLEEMRMGMIEFQGVYYIIDNILPKAYVEDVFLMYTFKCTEDKYVKELSLEEIALPPEETEDKGESADPDNPDKDEELEGDNSGNEPENDGGLESGGSTPTELGGTA